MRVCDLFFIFNAFSKSKNTVCSSVVYYIKANSRVFFFHVDGAAPSGAFVLNPLFLSMRETVRESGK